MSPLSTGSCYATSTDGLSWTITPLNIVNGQIRALAISPSGKMVASGTYDGLNNYPGYISSY